MDLPCGNSFITGAFGRSIRRLFIHERPPGNSPITGLRILLLPYIQAGHLLCIQQLIDLVLRRCHRILCGSLAAENLVSHIKQKLFCLEPSISRKCRPRNDTIHLFNRRVHHLVLCQEVLQAILRIRDILSRRHISHIRSRSSRLPLIQHCRGISRIPMPPESGHRPAQ